MQTRMRLTLDRHELLWRDGSGVCCSDCLWMLNYGEPDDMTKIEIEEEEEEED